jgi:tetratricopeptide (TPR) repeat protein
MHSNNSAKLSLIFLIIVLLSCTPVSGYSSDATRWFDTGNIQVQLKNYSQAVDAFDHAIALEPSYFEAWNNKADALNKNNQYQDALIASNQTIRLNPQYIQGWLNRGTILYMLGQYDEELAAYDRAISIEPTNTTAWFFKGYSLAGMKKYDEAIVVFDKVKSLDPNYPRVDHYRELAVRLRDENAPFYIKYSIPIACGLLIWIFAGGFYYYKRTQGPAKDNSSAGNRQERRKNKQ